MSLDSCSHQSGANYKQTLLEAQKHCQRWQQLCTRFLPIVVDEDGWRFSRRPQPDDPPQGWKLHISATILTGNEVLEKVAPFLISRNAQFKAPISLNRLNEINSGIEPDYSQVGKFITVYPQTTEEAVLLARRLDKLTCGIAAPCVPFDSQYKQNSCVYYRYGGFNDSEIKTPDGQCIPAITDLSGNLVPDIRDQAQPDWISDPFPKPSRSNGSSNGNVASPLETTYRVFRALTQRGKGGVYMAVDAGANPPRLCVIKEGRRHGEVTWDGCDGHCRVRREAEILTALDDAGINAPRFFSSFQLGDDYYMAAEYIEGKNLFNLMKTRRRRFPVKRILQYAVQISELLARIHSAGWVWRDCKPENIIITQDGSFRPLDFEGAFPIGSPGTTFWRTRNYSPPEGAEHIPGQLAEFADLYALGAVVYFLFTGNIYQPDSPISIKKLRRRVPAEARETIRQLLSLDSVIRPTAKEAAFAFNKSLKLIE